MAKDRAVRLREEDDAALDDPTLVSSVEEALAGLESDEDEELADDVAEDSEPTPDDNDEPADDEDEDPEPTPDDNEDDNAEEKDVKDGDEPAEEDDGLPDLPDAYYRSAARYGWKPDAIKEMVDTVGIEKVSTMLKNLHQKDNNMTGVFAQLGRKAKELEQAPTKAPDLKKEVTKEKKSPGIDLAALKEKYGDDDPLVDLYAAQAQQLAALTDSFENLNAQLAATQDKVSEQQAADDTELMKQVNSFFNGDGMSQYESFYGSLDKDASDWQGLSPAQMANRDYVCTLADQIIVGAKLHGDPISLEDAMERAHLVVSEPIAETITRNKILKSVEKRHKARVVRPAESKKSSFKTNVGKRPSKQELVSKTHERLAAIFKS